MCFCIDVTTLLSQQYLIENLPKILMLHLSHGNNREMDDRHILFPLILDVAPYCCNTNVCKIMYVCIVN